MLNHAIRFGALGLVALVGTAPAALVPTAPLTSPRPAEAAPAEAPRQMPQLECVIGFSKDYCGSLTPVTHPATSACITPIPEGSCRTLRFVGALSVAMSNNTQICGSSVTATCNESDTGRLEASSNFLIRLQQHCPYRGCWDGDAGFTFADGSTYKGPLTGTLGVGSHRPVTGPTTCSVSGGRDCERCYDVSFNDLTGLWRLGFEASFHGTRRDIETGEEVCITLSGDFYIRGTATTGPDWSNIWTVAGTADGIQLTFCP